MTVPWGRRDSQGCCQCACLPAALEDHVGSAVAGSVAPSGFQYHGGVSILDAERLQAQSLGDPAACWRGIQDDDRGGAVVVCQQSGHQAHHAGSDDCDATPTDAVGEAAHIGAVEICGGVQQSIRADGSHVGGVNAQDRFEMGWQSDEAVCQRVGPISAAVSVGHGDQVARADGVGSALGHPSHLHVAERGDRVSRVGRAGAEQTQLGIPSGVQGGVCSLDPAQVGARRQPTEHRFDVELALSDRSLRRFLAKGDHTWPLHNHGQAALTHRLSPVASS